MSSRLVLLIVVLALTQASAQHVFAPKAEVRILGSARVFQWNQPLRLPVALVNEGSAGFYVAKSFTEGGGGISGFFYRVRQLTGRKGPGCGLAGDRMPGKDERTAEQILREDFLYLPPGAFVGYELSPPTCQLLYPGKYRVSITYAAYDLNVERVAKVENLVWPVLVGKTNEISVIVELRLPPAAARKPPSP